MSAIHPLKIINIAGLGGLILAQLSLWFYIESDSSFIWAGILTLPLIIPIKGVISDRLYTYKWLGFLTLLYFCIGISELVSNPALRIYAILTTIFSVGLFLASIYYTRYLRLKQQADQLAS